MRQKCPIDILSELTSPIFDRVIKVFNNTLSACDPFLKMLSPTSADKTCEAICTIEKRKSSIQIGVTNNTFSLQVGEISGLEQAISGTGTTDGIGLTLFYLAITPFLYCSHVMAVYGAQGNETSRTSLLPARTAILHRPLSSVKLEGAKLSQDVLLLDEGLDLIEKSLSNFRDGIDPTSDMDAQTATQPPEKKDQTNKPSDTQSTTEQTAATDPSKSSSTPSKQNIEPEKKEATSPEPKPAASPAPSQENDGKAPTSADKPDQTAAKADAKADASSQSGQQSAGSANATPGSSSTWLAGAGVIGSGAGLAGLYAWNQSRKREAQKQVIAVQLNPIVRKGISR